MLSLSPKVVEWYDPAGGLAAYGRAEVEGPGNGALVAAAEAACRASGARRRPCIVSLADGLASHHLVHTPPLKKKELAFVFERRASKLLGVPKEDALFAALSAGGDGSGVKGGEDAWLLVAMKRAEMSDLRLRLRKRGFQVKRVVSGRQSVVCTARRELPDPDGAAIVVGIEPGAITITLIRGEVVVNQETIEGDFLENPSLASSLVHEVKSFAGYWKKHTRGEVLEQVAVLGLQPDRGELLSHAFETAMPGASVLLLPRDAGGENAGRFAYFAAAASTGSLNPDLTTRIPPRRRVLVSGLVAVFGLAGVLGWHLNQRVGRELDALGHEIEQLDAAAVDLPELERENARAAAGLDALRVRLERAAAVEDYGVALEDVLLDALGAFRGRADFVDINVRPEGSSGEPVASITGRADPRPAELLSSLGLLTRDLEATRSFADVELTLPEALPSPESGVRAIEFLIDARVEG